MTILTEKTVPYSSELQMSLSGAKNAKEVTGNVRFGSAPQKTHEDAVKYQKTDFLTEFSENFQKFLNVSKCIRMHLNVSEQVQTGASRSTNFKKIAKPSKKLRKTRENFREHLF